jgi:hypothetical protein
VGDGSSAPEGLDAGVCTAAVGDCSGVSAAGLLPQAASVRQKRIQRTTYLAFFML